MSKRQLISSAEAVAAPRHNGQVCQHQTPCSDCPWARTALNGWLGHLSSDDWLAAAHGETLAECHTSIGAQCAGMAIYRSNQCKRPRDPQILRLPANRDTVFASPQEFKEHHSQLPSRHGGRPATDPLT